MDNSNYKYSLKPLCDSLALSLQRKESREAIKKDSHFRKKLLLSENSLPFERLKGQRMKTEYNSPCIGIWSKRKDEKDNIFFTRNEELFPRFGGSEHVWSDIESFNLAKDNRQRIVYLGESVARGFVFDPIMAPANVLNEIINHSSEDFEVIDLACTGINGTSLLKLAQESLQLKPDFMIIHAGNNWWNALWGIKNQDIAQIFYRISQQEIADTLKSQMEIYAGYIIDSLIGFAASISAKLIFVLPEFNYLGWNNEFVTPSWLTEKELKIWLDNISNIKSHIAQEEFISAEELCKKTLNIDQGMCAYTLEIMARIYFAKSSIELAKKYFIRAKDTLCWQSQVNTPRCPSYIEEVIRKRISQAENAELIDLPKILSHNSKVISPPHWFVDYVHHSPEGIALIAQELAKVILGCQHFSIHYCAEQKKLASGYFLSALHNANYSQNEVIIKKWLIKAEESGFFSEKNQDSLFFFFNDSSQNILVQETFRSSDPIIKKFMNAFKLSLHSGIRLKKIYSETPYKPFKKINLNKKNPDSFESNWIDVKNIDRYRNNITDTPIFLKMEYDDNGYSSEMQPCSSFIIPVDASADLSISLCAKIPSEVIDAEFEVIINGQTHKRFIETQWANYHFKIDKIYNNILNIVIKWPLVHNPLAYNARRESELISGNINLSLFKIYGNIASIHF